MYLESQLLAEFILGINTVRLSLHEIGLAGDIPVCTLLHSQAGSSCGDVASL